jgi:glycogen synthase
MKKLHIIFLDFDDIKNPLLAGGQAKATFEVGARLVKKGHKITVISSKYPGYNDRFDHGIFYKHIGITTKNIKVNNALYILLLPFTVATLRADIIIECFTAPISTMFSPLFTKVPVIALSSSFDAKRFSKKYHLPFHLVEKAGLRFYRNFIALTESSAKKIRKENPQIITKVIPEGVGEEFFSFIHKKPKHILFLGRLDLEQKGIDLLLQSYAKIADKATYPLIIAGNGPDEKKLQKLIKTLHLEKLVRMTGATFGKKKEKYMSEALYVALPSRDETFSCFALEALAAGLPLIAFDIPGIAWSGNTVAMKAKAFDIEEYAQILLTSMNEMKMRKLGEEARAYAKNFTWDNVADKFEEFSYAVKKKEAHEKR